jgi:hypothetical protein
LVLIFISLVFIFRRKEMVSGDGMEYVRIVGFTMNGKWKRL